jgi:hypothetical protein
MLIKPTFNERSCDGKFLVDGHCVEPLNAVIPLFDGISIKRWLLIDFLFKTTI